VLSDLARVGRKRDRDGENEARQKDDGQCGKDPPNPAIVEVEVTEAACRDLIEHDRRDEEAGDHEENIDTDEAATTPIREGVKPDHRQDGYSAQPVDLRSISGGVRTRGDGLIGHYGYRERD